jgi:hypothetical protein
VRIHRKGYGHADWIVSPTCRVRLVLQPAGLHATPAPDHPDQPLPLPRPPVSPPVLKTSGPQPCGRRYPMSSTPTWA